MYIFVAVITFPPLWKNLWRVWKNLCYQQLFRPFAKSHPACMLQCINRVMAVAGVCYVAAETGVFSWQRRSKSFPSCQNRQRKPAPFQISRKFFVENNQNFHRYDLPATGDTVPKQKNGGTPCPVKWKSAV